MLLSSIPLYPHLYPMLHPSGSNASPLPPSYEKSTRNHWKTWMKSSIIQKCHPAPCLHQTNSIIMEIFLRIFWQIIRTNLHWDHQNPSSFKKYITINYYIHLYYYLYNILEWILFKSYDPTIWQKLDIYRTSRLGRGTRAPSMPSEKLCSSSSNGSEAKASQASPSCRRRKGPRRRQKGGLEPPQTMGIWGQNLEKRGFYTQLKLGLLRKCWFYRWKNGVCNEFIQKSWGGPTKITGNQLSKDQRRMNWGWVGNERDGTQWVQNDPLVSSKVAGTCPIWFDDFPIQSFV